MFHGYINKGWLIYIRALCEMRSILPDEVFNGIRKNNSEKGYASLFPAAGSDTAGPPRY